MAKSFFTGAGFSSTACGVLKLLITSLILSLLPVTTAERWGLKFGAGSFEETVD